MTDLSSSMLPFKMMATQNHEALRVLISLKKRRDLTELAGKIEFREDYNYKTMRKVRG